MSLLVLTGCANGAVEPTTTPSASAAAAAPPSASATEAEQASEAGITLTTKETELGTVVVDGDGMVIYQFDKDTQHGTASTCAGECAAKWPIVPGEGEIKLDGVTGTVGSVESATGEKQLTVNGWPVYYFAGDTEAGMTSGQAKMDVWWVISPAGEPLR